MTELRFTVNDILEAMRSKNIFYLEEVNLAVVETTGQISIYPDPNSKTNINKADIPPFDIVVDGKYRNKNLDYIGISKQQTEKILNQENICVEDILLLLIDGDKNYNLTLKELV